MIDLDDVNGNSRGDRAPGMSDICNVFKFPEKKWVTVRLFGQMQAEAGYWVKTKNKAGKQTKFYTPCPSYDPQTQERDSTKVDPWRDLQQKENARVQSKEISRDDMKVQYAEHYWIQGIVRKEVDNKPRKMPKPTKSEAKTGFKDKESDSWTPKFVFKIGRGLAGKLKDLKELNVVNSKKTGASRCYAVNDVKFGRDVRIRFDSSKSPAEQYAVSMGDTVTPMSEEELGYLNWDMSPIGSREFDTNAVIADFNSWAARNGVKPYNVKGKKSKDEDEDDDSDDNDEDDNGDFDEDEDEKPAKKSKDKKKAVAKGKKKSKDEEEDDDDEDDSDSDEDDSDDDFDDDDSDDSDDSDEDDFDEDDSDSDDDEEDEDEDEEDEKPAKKSKGKKPAAKGKKKSKDEDDDFDDEDDSDSDDDNDDDDSDFDEDEDDEDEKPAKKSKGKDKKADKKSKKKKKKSKKSDDEDEDDDL